MNPRLKRLALPIALVGAGTLALIGCIPLPGSYRSTEGGPRPEERIGKGSDGKPIQLGITTRSRVESVLGAPSPRLSSERVAVYEYRVVTGTLLWPLCFTATKQTAGRTLRLEFDTNDTLVRYKVHK